MGTYSIYKQFAGSTVLLTGSTGYVGQLVLERILRSLDVEKVYVLTRPKRGEDIQQRIEKLLSSPVFHLLRGNDVLNKVVPIAGDMRATDLGISLADRQKISRDTNHVIHCAADIRLEAGIHELLQANYEGTRQLLKLCCYFDRLESFVHVSSAYTNMNAQVGSLVKEAIYPLSYGDHLVDDYELVQELLNMPAHNANSRAAGLMKAWNFPNNYTLSKHLAEYMVADYQKYCKLPIAIARPTLISSVARDPYPGYTGNYAGHVGATLAFMAGLFDSPNATNYRASNVWDVIPSDVVVNDILAVAAAVSAGLSRSTCVTKTNSGRLLESEYNSSNSSSSQRLEGYSRRNTAANKSTSRTGSSAISLQAFSHGLEQRASGAPTQQQQYSKDDTPLLIIHIGSSTLYPLTIMESWNYGIEAYGAWPTGYRLCMGCAAPLTVDHEPNPAVAARYVAWTGWKVWAAAKLLSWLGQEKVAKKLSVGFESFALLNQTKTDVNLRFSSSNMQQLAAMLDPNERDEFLLLWKPQAALGLNAGAAMVPGAAPRYGIASSTAATAAAASAATVHGKASVAAAAHELLPAVSEEACLDDVIKAKLSSSSSMASSACTSLDGDMQLASTSSGSSSDVEVHTSDGEDYSCCSSSSGSGSPTSLVAGKQLKRVQQHHGARLSPESQAALAEMRAIPIQWRDFHINLGAFLYCTVFRMPEPAKLLPITNEQVLNWLNIKPEDAFVRHQFNLYK